MKRFLIVLFILLLTPCICFAADVSKEEYNEYLNEYDLSAFNELDDDTYSILKELGISSFDFETLSELSLEKIASSFKDIVLGKISSPIQGAISVLLFIILSSFFQSLKSDGSNEMADTYSVASAVIISVMLVIQISKTISISNAAIGIAADFIVAFVPAFCAIVATSGNVTTAFSTNSTLLMLSQGLSFVSSNVFMPLINCFLAIGICSGLSNKLNLSNLISSLKQIIISLISFVSAAFISFLSIKTSVASRADILGIRSVRFVINSVVPVIGSTISEGLLSIQSYSSLIKSSVGIVGIIAIALVFLPSIIEVVIWRVMLSLCVIISDVFGDNSVSQILKAFRETMLLINVVIILSMVTTIISFGILIAAKAS